MIYMMKRSDLYIYTMNGKYLHSHLVLKTVLEKRNEQVWGTTTKTTNHYNY